MTFPLRALPGNGRRTPETSPEAIAESYRRLAEVFHDVLSEQERDPVLRRIADTIAEIVPYDALTIYEADEHERVLVPVLARDRWADQILSEPCAFGEGVTGWAALHREAVLANDVDRDPRAKTVPGTPSNEPEALISIPLVARDGVKGALNVYRLGESAAFGEDEFELAKRFGDAAALALDNARIRARLEQQAQTDSLTGLANHRAFHERLRSELARATRTREAVALVLFDVDNFKKVNDVHGHGVGDAVLRELAAILSGVVRASDVVCRIGGEEFAVILPSCTAADAQRLAERVSERLATTEVEPVGRLSVSGGVAEAPAHTTSPRDLAAFAEAAMMTAKASGKGVVLVFDGTEGERPTAEDSGRDMRSIAQLKLLQSLAGKLNRLNEVRRIGEVIVNELRLLVDYHNCRVYVVEGDEVVPIAFRGELGEYGEESVEILRCPLGEGICGTVAATGQPLLLRNARDCEFAVQVPGTPDIDESIVAVPLLYGSRSIGVMVLSKLGVSQFDESDMRLLEVLAGQASIALENARLYEAERREAGSARESAEVARSLLELGRELAAAEGLDEVLGLIVERSAGILGVAESSLWLQSTEGGELAAAALWGYESDQEHRVRALRFPPDSADRLLARSEPYLVEADELARLGVDPGCEGRRAAVAPIRVEGRGGCLVAVIPPLLGEPQLERLMQLLGGIAHQAQLALANALSFEGLERTFLSTVEALANALEASDEYTSSHARDGREDPQAAQAGALQGQGRSLRGRAVRKKCGKAGKYGDLREPQAHRSPHSVATASPAAWPQEDLRHRRASAPGGHPVDEAHHRAGRGRPGRQDRRVRLDHGGRPAHLRG